MDDVKLKVLGFDVIIRSGNVTIDDKNNILDMKVGNHKPDARVQKILTYLHTEGFIEDGEEVLVKIKRKKV